MATFKLDRYIADAQVDPYVLDCGDDGEITITYPTVETLMEITETPINQSRKIMRLLAGDQYDKIFSVIGSLPATVFEGMVVDMITHFKIGQVQMLPGGPGASPR